LPWHAARYRKSSRRSRSEESRVVAEANVRQAVLRGRCSPRRLRWARKLIIRRPSDFFKTGCQQPTQHPCMARAGCRECGTTFDVGPVRLRSGQWRTFISLPQGREGSHCEIASVPKAHLSKRWSFCVMLSKSSCPASTSRFSGLATVEGRRCPSHSTDSAFMRLRPLRTLNELKSLRTCIPAGLCLGGMVGRALSVRPQRTAAMAGAEN
jgi:hypothetical protein